MPISIVCPSCGGRLKAPDTAGGRTVKCPKCGSVIDVPGTPVEPREPTRSERPARQKKGPAHDRADGGRSKTRLAAAVGGGGVLAVVASLGVLWAAGVFSPSEVKSSAPSAPPSPPAGVQLGGELFFANKDGQVMQLGGQALYVVPVTPELKESVRTCLGRMKRIDTDLTAFELALDKKYPDSGRGKSTEHRKYFDGYLEKRGQIVSDFQAALSKGERGIRTDADGRFRTMVPPGLYLVYTPEITVQRQRLLWGEVVEATKDTQISLDQKSAVIVESAWQSVLLYLLGSRLRLFVEPEPPPRTPAGPPLADLIKALDGPTLESRRSAIKALGELGPDAKDAVGPLIAALLVPALRLDAAAALGRIGPKAKDAVSPLYVYLDDSPDGRALLTTVLADIDPDAARAYRRLRELRLDTVRRRSELDLLQAKAGAAKVAGKIAELNDVNRQIATASQGLADVAQEVASVGKSLAYWGQPQPGPHAAEPGKDIGGPMPPPKPKERKRAGLLADLETKENTVLTALEGKYEKNKEVVRRIRAAEQSLLGNRRFGDRTDQKSTAAYIAFCKDQDEKVARVNLDTAILKQKREEFSQARRRIIAAEPEPTDPLYIDQDGLLLTEKEAGQVSKLRNEFPTPRSAADAHVKALVARKALAQPVYAATWVDPDNQRLAAVNYTVSGYRGKAVAEQPVHVFVYKTLGYWIVLELPDRADGILLGRPPSAYKRVEEKKGEAGADPFDRRK